jgi:hypothetical protein
MGSALFNYHFLGEGNGWWSFWDMDILKEWDVDIGFSRFFCFALYCVGLHAYIQQELLAQAIGSARLDCKKENSWSWENIPV